jgi:hypothetical protein
MTQKLWKTAVCFFGLMVEKLIHQHNTHGFSGWDSESNVSNATLLRKLRENIEKEDWVDVANLAMILDYRRGT